MIDLDIKISYFNSGSCESVEYSQIFPIGAKTFEEAKEEAYKILDAEYEDAFEDGMMPDTWYYEFDYLVDA